MSQTQCSPPTCGGVADAAQADTDMTSTSNEDLPTETLTPAHRDNGRILPNRQNKPIDPMHYMTHSPKHPD
eukprot:115764-Pyramimonas_sp.AAC.1